MSDFLFGEDNDMPTAKSYNEAYNEGISALANSLGQIYSSDAQYSPLFNAIYRQDQSDSLSQYNKDLWGLQLDAYEKYAPALAAAQLAYEKEYAPQFTQAQLENQRLADPTYWAIRDTLGAQVESAAVQHRKQIPPLRCVPHPTRILLRQLLQLRTVTGTGIPENHLRMLI